MARGGRTSRVERVAGAAVGVVPRLPARLWALEAAGLVSTLGGALVFPFVIIYLHDVRGIPLELAGAMLATTALTGLLGGLLGGWASDAFGPTRAATAAMALTAVAWALFPLVRTPWHGFAIAVLVGIAFGAFAPSRASLIAALADADVRHGAYSLEFAATNVAIGIGAALGGLVADVARPETFTALFLADAATSLLYAALIPVICRGRGRPVPRPARARGAGYREVVRQRPILAVAGTSLILFTAGVAMWEVGIAPFARLHGGLSERQIGAFFALNSAVIVLLQFPITRLLEGRRRMRALALTTVLWAVAWLVVAAAGSALAVGGLTLFLAAAVVFAIGECIVPPAQGALVADLAPEHLRGRCMALVWNAYGVGMAAGTAVIGLGLAYAPGALWPVAAALLLVAGGALLAVERLVPVDLRRVPVSRPKAKPDEPVVTGAALEPAR